MAIKSHSSARANERMSAHSAAEHMKMFKWCTSDFKLMKINDSIKIELLLGLVLLVSLVVFALRPNEPFAANISIC